MPIQIVCNDITKMYVDAIVTTGNKYIRTVSGADGAIHKATGPMLEIVAQQLGGCAVWEAKNTQGINLPCRCVIQTISPIWHGTELTAACSLLRRVFRLTVANGCVGVLC